MKCFFFFFPKLCSLLSSDLFELVTAGRPDSHGSVSGLTGVEAAAPLVVGQEALESILEEIKGSIFFDDQAGLYC